MTLYRQLIFAITFLIICLMAGNVFVSVFNARGYVFEQMQVHAQDTATSLGLTISHAAKEKDEAQIRSFVDVVFDRGYYRRVLYQSLSGDVTVESNAPILIEGVPDWFVGLVDLPEPEGHAEVISGWFRLGKVTIVSHPGYAYRDLWRVFNEQLWLFMFTAVLCYGLAGLGLRYLLRPLQQVEAQAEAICRREFPVLDDLPRTRELRRMVTAMNRMVQKIQSIFQEQVELSESLHRQAYLDSVTQLSNRRDFDARFEAFIKSEKGGSAGALVLIHLDGLIEFNGRLGREAGDQLLKDVAGLMVEGVGDVAGAILARRSGADLCVFMPLLDKAEGELMVERLFSRVQGVSWFKEAHELHLYFGAAFTPSVVLDNNLLEEADLALRQAQHQGASGYQWHQTVVGDEARSAGEWRTILCDAIESKAFTFHVQPVFARDAETIDQLEILCRLHDGRGLMSAGVFLPMAERFDMAADIDQLMIEMLSRAYVQASGPKLSVNISPSSMADESFVSWLEAFLQSNPAFAQRLVVELPEFALSINEQQVRVFGQRIVAHGACLSLDHFGVAASSFSYLQSLPLFALKVDRCFVQGIDSNADNRFFVKSLLQIAHSCDVKLLVEGVENDAEWQALLALGIDGGQGYYLAKPAPASQELG